ncbi:hypothetical protein CEXT_60361 [Caerostris extrusa]|uniref:Secreted protein n=1 Tax=Caerostris extrusa TaxID=172846 RepID=A0AAV4XK10_CAEEX|nr:hypothetical protein CEXT_60361 [Caerostris extrusa]
MVVTLSLSLLHTRAAALFSSSQCNSYSFRIITRNDSGRLSRLDFPSINQLADLHIHLYKSQHQRAEKSLIAKKGIRERGVRGQRRKRSNS